MKVYYSREEYQALERKIEKLEYRIAELEFELEEGTHGLADTNQLLVRTRMGVTPRQAETLIVLYRNDYIPNDNTGSYRTRNIVNQIRKRFGKDAIRSMYGDGYRLRNDIKRKVGECLTSNVPCVGRTSTLTEFQMSEISVLDRKP